MEERLTEELLDELLSSPSADAFLDENAEDLVSRRFDAYFRELLEACGRSRTDVVRDAGVDPTYGYQLSRGQRKHPSRDIVLALAFAMGLSLRETDRLLQAAGVSRLYCKSRRDAIIVFCLSHGASVAEVNEALYKRGEATIS